MKLSEFKHTLINVQQIYKTDLFDDSNCHAHCHDFNFALSLYYYHYHHYHHYHHHYDQYGRPSEDERLQEPIAHYAARL